MYQPGITRLPSLLFLFIFTLLLIGLTEYAVRHYPAHSKGNALNQFTDEITTNLPARLVRKDPQQGE